MAHFFTADPSSLLVVEQALAFGLAVVGVGAAWIVQCGGGNKRAPPKKSLSASKKSKKGSSKSARGDNSSKRSAVKSSSKRSARSAKSSKSASKSSKSASSKRGAAGPSQRLVTPATASQKSSRRASARNDVSAPANADKSNSLQPKSARTARSSKRSDREIATARPTVVPLELKTAREDYARYGSNTLLVRQDTPVPKDTPATAAASTRKSKTDVDSSKSLQETQKSPPNQSVKDAKQQPQPVAAPATGANNSQQLQLTQQQQQGLQMEPRELRFSNQGGLLKVSLANPTGERQAIKIKCSDNNLYRVNPVYAFVEPHNTLDVEVVRQNGTSKLDKLVFVTSKAPETETDPKLLFKSAPKAGQPKMVLPLMA